MAKFRKLFNFFSLSLLYRVIHLEVIPQSYAKMILPIVVLVNFVAVLVECGCRLRIIRPIGPNRTFHFMVLNSFEDTLYSVAPVGSIVLFF